MYLEDRQYVYKDNKRLRCGYTTGTCAAAAAKAAAAFLLLEKRPEIIEVDTPAGKKLEIPIASYDARTDADGVTCTVTCGVRKDGGDDADVTDGILILASVSVVSEPGVHLDGGKGVGRITRAGLDQPVGNAAINSVPRQVICGHVQQILEESGLEKGLRVILSIPEGEAVAGRTFNPALGIEGGLSILGTSGIVEPMSEKALVDTIEVEMKMHGAAGEKTILITPGNYGLEFIRESLGLHLEQAVKCSNFIGETMDMAWPCGFEGVLLVGHLGKLIKLGAGIMNTHSRNADGRAEIMVACALQAGADTEQLKELYACVTTDAMVDLLEQYGIRDTTMEILMKKIGKNLEKRGYEGLHSGAIVFSKEHGLLGQTDRAAQLFKQIKEQQKER